MCVWNDLSRQSSGYQVIHGCLPLTLSFRLSHAYGVLCILE